MLRGLTITSVYLISLAAILFVSAGRMDWPMAWASLGVYLVVSLTALAVVDRELIAERAQLRAGIETQDALLASLSFVFFLPLTLLVAGLDVGRFGWSPSFPRVLQVMALAMVVLGNAFGCWAMARNKFFSTFVRIQTDRGHEVVSDGPYRYVRHPGYAGAIFASVALPLALGSLWALIPAFIGACGFVIRTVLEDQTLAKELSGYRNYAGAVRYRLIPGIW